MFFFTIEVLKLIQRFKSGHVCTRVSTPLFITYDVKTYDFRTVGEKCPSCSVIKSYRTTERLYSTVRPTLTHTGQKLRNDLKDDTHAQA